ncbi:MAG: GtrA family protein [Clostridia bacterium]|nr:GtrA family protein [Clostridia bacterium]MDR3645823.1 GtrA family protein [Clostridia bacterium]
MKKFFRLFFDRSFLIFLCVGAFNTVLSLGITYLLYNLFYANHFNITDCRWASSSIAYAICSVSAYILNRRFTFTHKGPILQSILRFALVISVCYVIANVATKPLTEFLLDLLRLNTVVSDKVVGYIAILVAQVIFTALNYLGQRFFAFKKEPDTKTAE